MSHFQKYKDDFVLLLEGGFIAAHQADEDAATKLFRAAQLLKPDSMMPKIGLGYVHFLKLELKQANTLFDQVLHADPNNHMARAMMGLSMAFTIKDVEKGEKLLKEALSKTQDPAVKQMARTSIEFIEKHVKKAPTPVQGTPASKKKGRK